MLDISIFSSYANVDSEGIDKLDYFKIINKYFIKSFSLKKEKLAKLKNKHKKIIAI